MDLSAVSSVLETIGKLAQQEVTSLLGVDEQIESLERELGWMQSFLEVADARKADNAVIRISVAEIRELAYDADDVIETFALKIASERIGGFSGCIKRFACFLKECCLLHHTKSEIEKITVRIKELTRQLQTYDVTKLGVHGEGASSSTERRDSRRLYPHIGDDHVVGLDGDIEKLVSVLVEERSECKVVSICGMGGLGKTTLAKKIYRHNQVINHFNHLVWVYVSQQYQKRKVWEDILSGLKNLDNDDKNKSAEQIAEKLFNFLKDKKCMVILDDIWSIEAWDSLKHAFPVSRDNNSSSKILLTSRNMEIASHADTRGYLHELQCLNNEQSWELFQNIAFAPANSTENRVDPKMKELGEEMVKHCAGLPLAISVLGGILATKNNSLNEWLKVSANVKSYLKRGKSQGLLLEDVLALSYDDLSPYLRPCFLYLSHFPEDYGIPMDKLIQLLVAEGIVSKKQEEGDSGEIAEDVAEGYLMELVERCMIQVRERDIATLKVKTFEMHDLMRDLCLSKAKQEKFTFIVDRSNACSSSTIRRVRRVSAHEFFWVQCIKSPNLRSLFFFNEFTSTLEMIVPRTLKNYMENHRNPSCLLKCIVSIFLLCNLLQKCRGIWTYMLNNFKLLRVLDYGGLGCGGVLCTLPSDIGNLIHLRFLNLRGVGFMCTKLPSSLGNLRCLQTLDLRTIGDQCHHVPNVIWRMEQLRHLYLPKECSHKTKLKLDTLRNLQTLVNFNTKNCYLKDLINMTNIRVLVIRGTFNIEDFNEEELDKNPPIIQCKYLHSLSILTDGARIDPRHLTHLLSSCGSICVLNLHAQISKLPEEHYLSSSLAFISLRLCRLEEDQMVKLEKLRNLRSLELHSGAFIGKEIFCSAQGFPELVSLTLKELDCLEEWKVDEGGMPSLQRLEIEKCRHLKMLPDGLKSITKLQEVKMKSMPKAFNDKVVQGGEDHYKVQHVPSIIFLDRDEP